MMNDALGVSFSPTGNGGPNAQKPTPVQQAIQTLSLRVPSHVGASAFTPQALLPSPTESGGSVGGAPDMLLEAIKRLLFGPAQQGTQPVPGGGPVLPPDGQGPILGTQPVPGGRTFAPGPRPGVVVNPGTGPGEPRAPAPPRTLDNAPAAQPSETAMPSATFPVRPPRPDNRV